jgi:ATP-dependent Lhr-like helicase
MRHLVEQGFIERDGDLLLIGPQAEARFGHRHFMGMTAVFTAPPQFTVVAGRQEIGRTDPTLLTEKVQGPRLILLAGRSWRVTWIDWTRRRCFVEPADGGGRARWHTPGVSGASFALCRAAREVLLGADPPVRLTHRATARLSQLRENAVTTVHPGGTLITREDRDVRWWTWAGYRANATLSGLTDQSQRVTDTAIRLRADLTADMWRTGTADAADRICLPEVDERAVAGLKFSEALPYRLATATLAARLADIEAVKNTLAEPARLHLDR